MAEDTVTDAEGLAKASTRSRRARKKVPPVPEPVSVMEVNRTVWKAAKEAAGGDPRRIEILSRTRVMVHPTPRI